MKIPPQLDHDDAYNLELSLGRMPLGSLRDIWSGWSKKQRLAAIESLIVYNMGDAYEFKNTVIEYLNKMEID